MRRRSFLASILAAGVAPAAVGSGILMPVRHILVPPSLDPPLQGLASYHSTLESKQAEWPPRYSNNPDDFLLPNGRHFIPEGCTLELLTPGEALFASVGLTLHGTLKAKDRLHLRLGPRQAAHIDGPLVGQPAKPIVRYPIHWPC